MKKIDSPARDRRLQEKALNAQRKIVVEQQEQTIAQLNAQIQSQNQALANAQSAANNAGNNLAAKVSEIQTLKNEISSLTALNTSLQTQLESKSNEILALKEQIRDIEHAPALALPQEPLEEGENSPARQENRMLKAELEQKNIMVRMLTENIAELKLDKDDLKHDKKFLQEQNVQFSEIMVKKEAELELLKSRMPELEHEVFGVQNPFRLDDVATVQSEEVNITGSFEDLDEAQ